MSEIIELKINNKDKVLVNQFDEFISNYHIGIKINHRFLESLSGGEFITYQLVPKELKLNILKFKFILENLIKDKSRLNNHILSSIEINGKTITEQDIEELERTLFG